MTRSRPPSSSPPSPSPSSARPPRPPLPAGLYAIADAAFGDPVALGLALSRAGCAVVQLRCKGWSAVAVTEAARALQPELRSAGTLLIVNDVVEAAVAAGADGVHLGQDDGALHAARAALGPAALIGRSTHDLEQVRRAVAEGADYLGFGPIFTTGTKPDSSPVVGPAGLARAVQAAGPVPVTAIGGITAARLDAVEEAGAHAWAVISALLEPAAAGPEALARAVAALRGRNPPRS